MKLSLIFTTFLAAIAAAATATGPPSFGIPTPTPASVPKPLPACSKTVDTAVGAAGAAIKMFLAHAGSKVPHLDEAIHAGNTCFRREIGCGVGPADDALPRPGQLDCSGTIDKGLKYAVAALRAGFSVFLPTGYDRGVKEGLECWAVEKTKSKVWAVQTLAASSAYVCKRWRLTIHFEERLLHP